LVSKKVFFRTSKAKLSEKLGFSGTANHKSRICESKNRIFGNQGFACFVGGGFITTKHKLFIMF